VEPGDSMHRIHVVLLVFAGNVCARTTIQQLRARGRCTCALVVAAAVLNTTLFGLTNALCWRLPCT